MKTLEFNFKVPQCLVAAVCNSDFSGLDSSEEQMFECLQEAELDIIADNKGSHGTWSFEDDADFCVIPDFTNLACDCVNAVLTVFIP